MGEGLAEWIVTGPGGQELTVQLAYFDRDRDPVAMDIGPVLDLPEVAGGKVCALASRVELRDYADTAAMLDRYTPAQLISFARRLDPGLTAREFADAGRHLDQISDAAFARYGLTPCGRRRAPAQVHRLALHDQHRQCTAASRRTAGMNTSESHAEPRREPEPGR